MLKKSILTALGIAVMISLTVETALPNGVNPPRTSSSTTLAAICNNADGKDLELNRVRLFAGKRPIETIRFTIGGHDEKVKVTDIGGIVLKGRVDAQGYVKAKIFLNDDTEAEGKLKIKTKEGLLQLKGFNSSRSRVAIEISRCRSLWLTPVGGEEGEAQGWETLTAD